MPHDPLILGFDTSAAHCAAAVLSGDKILATAHEDMAKGQAERLMPLIQEVLTAGGATWGNLDAIGVGIGPGNFTGIRIAVSAARGLALSLSIPAVGVSNFDIIAFGHPRPLRAVLDARRDMAYVQDFTDTGPSDPRLMPRSEIATDIAMIEGTGGLNVAERIARIAATRWQAPQERPAPLYLRAADAAPPSDKPPVILDDA